MQEVKDNAKGRKFFKLVATDAMMKQLKEIAEKRSKPMSDIVRDCIERYYYGDFRKEEYGYMSGVGVMANNPRKAPGPKISDREEMVLRLNNMTNDEVTAWINNGDFMTKQEKELEDWVCRTSPDTGEREIFGSRKNMEPGSKYERTVMGWPEFISEVRKYYKNKKDLEKIS